MNKKILVVEDDPHVSEIVTRLLENERKYDVTTTNSAEEAELYLTRTDFDLLILDWGLPSKSGVDLCRDYLRSSTNKAPVLLLTGKSTISEKEIGFKVGADDYLTKPFDTRELLLRVQALLKRGRNLESDIVNYRDITIDRTNRRVLKQKELELRLTKREFDVLEFLMRQPGKFASSRDLMANLWGAEEEASDESVRVLVHRLRSRLAKMKVELSIENSHGQGYRVV